MDFITLQNLAIADLNIEGYPYPLEKYKTLINTLRCFSQSDTKKLVAKIVNDYNSKKIFERKVHIGKTYQVLGSGSYGIVFGTEDSEYCVKFNFFKSNGDKDYNLPKQIIANNKDLEELIVDPISFFHINFSGLVYYFSLYYSLYVIILHSVYNQDLNTREFLNNLKTFKHEWSLPSLRLEKKHKYLFYSILEKYAPFQHIDFFDDIELLCDILKPKRPLEGSLLFMKRGLTTSDLIKVNASGQYDPCGYCPYSEEDNPIFRILTLHVFTFILNACKDNNFIHRDLKPNNVLVFSSNPYYLEYNDQKFAIQANYRFCINDFGISSILPSGKPKGIAKDTHFFAHSMFYFFRTQYQHDLVFFQQLYNIFIAPYCNSGYANIKREVKCRYSQGCQKGQLSSNIEYPITSEVLASFLESSLFDKWRIKT